MPLVKTPENLVFFAGDGSMELFVNILVAGIGFGIDIEVVFVVSATTGFVFFKRGADDGFQFTQQGVTEISIVKMAEIAPEAIITVTVFRN